MSASRAPFSSSFFSFSFSSPNHARAALVASVLAVGFAATAVACGDGETSTNAPPAGSGGGGAAGGAGNPAGTGGTTAGAAGEAGNGSAGGGAGGTEAGSGGVAGAPAGGSAGTAGNANAGNGGETPGGSSGAAGTEAGGAAGAGAGTGGAGGTAGGGGSEDGAGSGGETSGGSAGAGAAGAAGDNGGGAAGAGGATIPTGGVCNVAIAEQGALPSPHLTECSFIPYTVSNPPSSGPHYPIWAMFKTYDTPVPRGYLVHDLEHGAIVITYNCAASGAGSAAECAAEVAKAQAVIDAFVDPMCNAGTSGSKKRVTMAPDPALDVPFAVAAWGHTLRATCVDATAFPAFMNAHFDQASESFCSEGVDVIAAGLQPKCGQEDWVAPTP
jgi:hypothetical protein